MKTVYLQIKQEDHKTIQYYSNATSGSVDIEPKINHHFHDITGVRRNSFSKIQISDNTTRLPSLINSINIETEAQLTPNSQPIIIESIKK